MSDSGKAKEPEIIKVREPLQPWKGRARDYRPLLSEKFKKRQKLNARASILLRIQKEAEESDSSRKKSVTIRIKKTDKEAIPALQETFEKQIHSLKENLELEQKARKELEKRLQQHERKWNREKEILEKDILEKEKATLSIESQLRINKGRLQKSEEQQKKELQDLMSQIDQLKSQLSENTEENTQLEKQLEYERDKRKALHQIFHHNLQENVEEAAKVADADRERQILKRRLQTAEEEKKVLEDEITQLSKKQEVLRQEVRELERDKKKKIELEEKVTNLDSQLGNLQKKYDLIKGENSNLEEQLERFKSSQMSSFLPGDEIAGSYGCYRIKSPLKSGGMGDLFLAQRLEDETDVVVKTMQVFKDGDESKKVLRFIQEAQMSLNFDHPNLVKGLDFFQSPKLSFFVMEYVQGVTLEQLFNENHDLPEQEIVRIILQIAQALNYFDKIGIIHRDIKPSNVMINSDGIAKVMDFGILKLLGTKCNLTTSGIIVGTPYYLSPEQVTEEKADIKSDVYSLGITFFQMLVGQVPFSGENHVEVIAKRLTKTPPRADKFNPDLNKNIVNLIERMMDKKANKRPFPYEIIEELEDYLAKNSKPSD